MKKIQVADLFEYSAVLMRYSGHPSLFQILATEMPGNDPADILKDPVVRQHHVEYLRKLAATCEEIELNVSSRGIERLIRSLEEGSTNRQNIEPQYREIRRRMEDELKSVTFLMVEPSGARLYEKPLDGWEDVIGRFPDSTRDIEEASKCLALERSTACVFHCMRIAESGLDALAKDMGIDYEYKNWDKVLKQLAYIAETDYQKLEGRWKGHRQRFLDVRERLWAIKDALRNPTMHVRGTYTEEMAEDVYRSVKGFIKNLASWV